jgi:uncharacterized protein (PEP-CTERM system associated)
MRQFKKNRSTGPRSRFVVSVALVAAAGAASDAKAEQWRVVPRVTVEQAYNDNIDLTPKGTETSDFITSISPGLGVRGTGRRLTLNFDYDPEQLFFLENSDRNELRQRFRGFTNAELLEQLLFLEASGSVNQQFVNNRGGIGGTTLSSSRDLRTVQTYTVGPVVRNHLGSFADAETRYTFSTFLVDDDTIADTTQNELSFLLRSGRQFTDLAWDFNANASNAERDGGTGTFSGTEIERRLAKLNTQYAFNSTWSLLTGVGYETIDDPTLFDPPDGVIWDVGFQVRPNSVSTGRFTVGRRFGGSNYNLEVNYLPSPLTRLRASYVQSINTSQGLGVQDLSSLALGPSGNLIDGETGQPFLPGDPRFGLTNSAFRQDRFSAGIEHTSLRNRYTLDIFDEKRDFDVQPQNNTQSRGIILGFNRSLTPLLSLNLSGSYSLSEFENLAEREDDIYSGNAGLSYRLSDTAQARFNYRHTERKSTSAASELTENFVAVTLLKEF